MYSRHKVTVFSPHSPALRVLSGGESGPLTLVLLLESILLEFPFHLGRDGRSSALATTHLGAARRGGGGGGGGRDRPTGLTVIREGWGLLAARGGRGLRGALAMLFTEERG